MRTSEVVASDRKAREALRSDFASTLFVDAGAGTGKTTAIVERIGELVAKGEVRMAQLVAITFTEAAAAELRTRVREALQRVAGDTSREAGERERCRQAGVEIADASIDTIHAFAGDLLRTYPLDAGIPPDLSTMDEIEGELDFDDRFRAWFDGAAQVPSLRDTVRRCLLLGLAPDKMEELAEALHANYDLLSDGTTWECDPAPDPVSAAHRMADELREARNMLRYAPAGHVMIGIVEGLGFAEERLREASTEDEALVALLAVEGVKGKGNMNGWPKQGGVNTLATLKDIVKGVGKDAGEVLAGQRSELFCRLLDALRDFVIEYSRDRKKLGVATFQDLLVWARDMLRDNPEVRSRVQSRWTRIFIDEFQDTDPLQAEIAFYLCADPASKQPDDWRKMKLLPGKLCLVGDPKQSIYRFRRADIALYQAIRRQVAEPLVLSRNFRSVPAVIEFVNRHFSEAMTYGDGSQPAYQELAADVAPAEPAVWRFGGEVDGNMPEVWQNEADGVAGAVARILAEKWKVSRGSGDKREPSEVRPEDICVLIPSRTNQRRLERAFEARGIGYRIESGELIIETQEVRDLIAALRAIDDPSDQVALVAALRSPIYGCSDPELTRWATEGGRFSYDYTGSGKVERVAAALDHLRAFHERRNQSTVAALVERFIDDRMLVAATFGDPRPREAWRRYRYVVSRARAFAATGRTSLREFVEWMEGLSRNQAREVSGSVVESDEQAVRVLTVHRAKGLEFPVVILTGLGSSRNFRTPPVIGDRVTDQVNARVKDTRKAPWQTPGYEHSSEVEEALAKAEEIRLQYVAATRARDHLVVSLFHKGGTKTKSAAAAFGETLVAMGGRVREVTAPEPAGALATAAEAEPPAGDLEAEEQAWVAAREQLLARVGGVRYVTATGRAHLAEGEEPRAEPDAARFRRGRGGTSLGRAVHAVLQSVDLATLDGLENLARAHAAAEGVGARAGEVARLARRAAESEPVRRAVAAGRLWREVPIGAPDGDGVLEGFIDLLFETPEGFEVVDYKTDDVSAAEVQGRMERYEVQGRSYATLVEKVAGRRPSAVHFVFANLGRSVTLVPGAA